MDIVRLRIKNFLSIIDVELTPGKVTQITGRNGQGKTSILKALEFAARGASDGTLVRNGADSAEVIVELADQTEIRRRVTTDGKQSLDVKKEGFTAPKPQAYVDGLFAEFAFNPLEVLDPKRRTDLILMAIALKISPTDLAGALGLDAEKLPPLDYEQHGLKVIDQAYRFYYQRRAEANKDAADKKKRLDTYQADLPKDVQAPALTRAEAEAALAAKADQADAVRKEITDVEREQAAAKKAQEKLTRYSTALDSIAKERAAADGELAVLRSKTEEKAALLKRYDAARDAAVKHIREVDDARRAVDAAEEKVTQARKEEQEAHSLLMRIADVEKKIAETETRITILDSRKAEGEKHVAEAKAELPEKLRDGAAERERLNALTLEREQMNTVFAELDRFDAVEKQRAIVAQIESEHQAAKAFADSLTEKVEQLSGPIKAKLMAQVEMPVKGLEYREGTFALNGVGVENLSSSEAIRLAIGVARRLSKKTKLICLDGAEALDQQSYDALREEINGDGYAYFVTKVGEPFASDASDRTVTMENGKVSV